MKKNTIYIGLALIAAYLFLFRKNGASSSANPFSIGSGGGSILPQLSIPKNTGGLGNTATHVTPAVASNRSPASGSGSGIGGALSSLGALFSGIKGVFKLGSDTGTGKTDASGSQGLTSAIDPYSFNNIIQTGNDATDFGGVPVLPSNSVFYGGQERPFMLSDYTGNFADNFDVGGYSTPSLSNDLIVAPNSDNWGSTYASSFDPAAIDTNSLSTPLSDSFTNDGTNYVWDGSSFQDSGSADYSGGL